MTTTDTDALTERIARVIYGEDPKWGYTQAGDCHGVAWETLPEPIQRDMLEMAAAVLPIVAEEVRKAKAEALREAARYFAGGLHCADMRATPEETVRDLNRRAAEYETGDSDDHQ